MSVRFRLKGQDAMARRLKKVVDLVPSEVAKAMYLEMEIEATECKERTPVDTGALRASEHVTLPEQGLKKISVSIVAGGATAPYAIKVHEDLEAHHPVGQAKFIESVLDESAPFMAERIARRVDLSKLT